MAKSEAEVLKDAIVGAFQRHYKYTQPPYDQFTFYFEDIKATFDYKGNLISIYVKEENMRKIWP